MHLLASAICDRELSGSAPDWVHLFPAGRMTGRDGRRFSLSDPQAVIAAFDQSGVDLPVDYEHQNDRKPQGVAGPIPAAGWIKELKSEESGLWGRVEWTAQARELIEAKAYRYLSPSFLFEPLSKAVTRLKGAGLVHNPNLHLHALACQEDSMADEPSFMQRVLKTLDLPVDAGADTMIEAIHELKTTASAAIAAEQPDPTRFVPIEAVEELMQDRHQFCAEQTEARVSAKVADAIGRGCILPRMKDWATALCRQNETSFDEFVSSSVPAAYAHLLEPVLSNAMPPPASSTDLAESPEAAAICAQLGLSPDALK